MSWRHLDIHDMAKFKRHDFLDFHDFKWSYVKYLTVLFRFFALVSPTCVPDNFPDTDISKKYLAGLPSPALLADRHPDSSDRLDPTTRHLWLAGPSNCNGAFLWYHLRMLSEVVLVVDFLMTATSRRLGSTVENGKFDVQSSTTRRFGYSETAVKCLRFRFTWIKTPLPKLK